MDGRRFVRTELENGMAIKGGSAVLSQIHGAISARWGNWTPLCSAPRLCMTVTSQLPLG